MKNNTKKVLTCFLTALVILSTFFPNSGLAFADENQEPRETKLERVEKPVSSSENTNSEEIKNNPEEIKSNLDETKSHEPSITERSKRATSTAKAPSDSTGKVELKIARLVGSELKDVPLDWYTQQTVDSIVDLDISGNNYTINKPYLVLKLPKTNKIIDVKLVDSDVAETERYEDEDYQYIKYKYTSLSGGRHFSYQYFFKFDGHHAKSGDTIKAEAQLFDGNDKLIKKTEQTYRAKTVGFDIYTSHGNGSMYNIQKTTNDDGHDYIVPGYIDKEGDTKTVGKAGKATVVHAAVFPKKVEGISENVGIEYPKNLKIVYTYLKDEPGFRPVGKAPHGAGGYTGNYTWKEEDNKHTFIINNPTFASDYLNYVPGNRQYTYANLITKDNGVTVNKKVPIRIDFYKNVEKDGTGGELIGTRYENFTFKPQVFTSGQRFGYSKYCFGNYNIADEFNYIYHPDYYHLNGKFFKGQYNMDEKGGIPSVTFISNYNKGSSYSKPYEGGKTDKINEIYTRLDSEKTFFRSIQLTVRADDNKNTNNEKNIKAAADAINNGNTRVYGIDKEGKEHLLKEHIQYKDIVEINDNTRKYDELVIRFEKPVELDNLILQLKERQWFIDSEIEELKNLNDGMHSYSTTSAVSHFDEKTNTYIKGKYQGNSNNTAFFTVTPLHPTVDTFISSPKVAEYKQDATLDYAVGPKLPKFYHDQTLPYGELKNIKNVKTITLLPTGYEYTGKYEKYYEVYSNWRKDPIEEPEITTIKNYKGTGKTAIIVKYGDIKIAGHYPIVLKIRATKYAHRGESDFVNYMTYDDNDFVRPIASNKNRENDYVDALDLDDDGNLNEVFMQKHTTVTFVPPLELVIQNTVTQDGAFSLFATGDLGYDITHKINIFNNSIRDVKELSIINVLPHKNDHAISPNKDGEYPSRNSTFATPLAKAIEDVNDEELNKKIQFLYQLEPQGKDLASVRDGKWLTKEQVKDFSKVSSIKIMLREGELLKSKEEFNILIPSRLPGDTSLNETSDVAINSSAFSTDNINYTEGNITKVQFKTYLVKGIAYMDINQNGKYDDGDILQKNITVNVLNKDGTQAVGFNNKPITAKTDSDGKYSCNVYKRGEYMVEFKKTIVHKYSDKSSGEEDVANSIDKATIGNDSAKTMSFALNPVHTMQLKNVGLLPNYSQINILKTSEDEKNADGSPKKLKGVQFSIVNRDGKKVSNYKGEEIKNIVTDEKGEAKFELVPYGEYIVKEVKTGDAYILSDKGHAVSLSDQTVTTKDDGKKVITLEVKNKLKRGTIKLHKIDNTTKKTPLKGVEFTLYDNAKNKVGDSKVTDENGNVQFENVPYGEYVIKETKGISGHEKLKGYIHVKVLKDKEIYSIEVVNNKINPKINLSGKKVWEDENNQDGIRPDSITIHLLANDKEAGKSTTATKASKWEYAFKDLPTYDQAGEKITYSIKEDVPQGYTSKIDGTAITNKHAPKLRDIKVSKEWKGNKEDKVTVHLLANGNTTDKKLILNAENNWEAVFKDLAKYKDGKEIEYTVSEEKIAGYIAEITGTPNDGFVITNTYKPKPVSVDSPISKLVEGNPKVKSKFTFKMKALNEDFPMPEGSVDGEKTIQITGAGSNEFGEIEFKLPGTYSYEITEINDGIKNYKYDKSIYVITFEVEDKDGGLYAKQNIVKKTADASKAEATAKEIVFKNKYEEPKKEVVSPKTGDKNHPITYMAFGGLFSSLLLMTLFKRKRNA